MNLCVAISVVVRTRNRPWFLARTLQSIADQTGDLPEIVVVNDGGQKREVDLVVERVGYKGRAIKTIHNPNSLGRGGAWNVGIRAATGEWLATLDDDDTWAPEFCSTVSEVIQSKATAGCAIGGVVTRSTEVIERRSGEEWRTVSTRPFNPRLQSIRLRDLVLHNRFTNNAFVFPRQVFEEVGPIREDLPVLEDWEFNVRVAAKFPICLIPQALARYHKRTGGESVFARNTSLQLHLETLASIHEAWIREDVSTGRFGLGALSLASEIATNDGLRLFNRVASWIRR